MYIFALEYPNWQCQNSSVSFFFHNYIKLAASTPCTLMKFIWYRLSLCVGIEHLLLGALTIHSFTLNCTFNLLDKIFLAESNLGMHKKYFLANIFGFTFHQHVNNNGSHFDGFHNAHIIQMDNKWINYLVCISAILWKVVCFVHFKFMIYKCGLCCIPNA